MGANCRMKMASHVSDTERAIFWTRWRVQQCYRTAGNAEKCGEFCRNSTLKRKLSILVTISVFLLFCLKTQISWESNKSKLTADPPDEENLMPRNPEVIPNNRINVNKQQDLIQAEKFEVNNVGVGFDEAMSEKDERIKEKPAADNGNAGGIPVLEPPNDLETNAKKVEGLVKKKNCQNWKLDRVKLLTMQNIVKRKNC